MNQTNKQNELLENSKIIWILAISIVATALIVGGAMYGWQRSNLKSTEKSIERQISLLQGQIEQLQQTMQDNQILPSTDDDLQPGQDGDEQDAVTEEEDLNGDETADDQAATESDLDYVNRNGGYGFNHPDDWYIETNGSSAYINGGKFAGVGIVNYQGSIEDYLEFLENNTQAMISGKENVQVAYTMAVKYMQSDRSPEGLHYLVLRDDKIINLYLTSITKEDMKKFETIIDSFTFFK